MQLNPLTEKSDGVLHRSFPIEQSSISEESRTVNLAFSSEEEYARADGGEILDHNPESVLLDRMADGAPVLVDHDPTDHVGVVEKAVIDGDKVGRAQVRFGKSKRATEIFTDIVDGIRRSVSVGYKVMETQVERSAEGDDPGAYRVTRWQPIEVSLVSIPADSTVGVGRSTQIEETKVTEDKVEVKAEEVVVETPEVEAKPVPSIDVDHERELAVSAERKRVADIADLGDKAGHKELAQEFIKQGGSVADLNAAIVSRLAEDSPVIEAKEVGLTQTEARSFSFLKAIRAMANPGDRKAQADAAFEREVSDAAAKAYGKEARGFMVPNETLHIRADERQNTVDDAALVAEDHLGGSFIEILRNRLVVSQMGIQRLSGLRGDIDIPTQESSVQAYWVGEDAAPTNSEATFGSKKASPKTVAAYVDMTRRILIQSDPSIEALIRADLAYVMAQAVDSAAISGDGTSNAPIGVMSTAGISKIPSATISWGDLIDMQSALDSDNALNGSLSYLLNPVEAGTAKQTAKATGEAIMLMTVNPGSIAGYPAHVSNQIEAGSWLFGDWSQLIMCEWSGLDLMVDPYSLSTSGGVRTTAFHDLDFVVRHAESFCLATTAP
jgi:HK97 family phage major capsid protein